MCKILVVDDNRQGCDTLTQLFRALGHKAESAYCGKDAIQRAYDFLPDAILLDIGMPDMSGWDVAETLRQDANFRDTKLYALTAYDSQADIQRSYDVGIDYHFVKPILDMESFWEIMRKHGLA